MHITEPSIELAAILSDTVWWAIENHDRERPVSEKVEDLVLASDGLTTREIVTESGATYDAVRQGLLRLKKRGVIAYHGKRSLGYWTAADAARDNADDSQNGRRGLLSAGPE